ncbi:MAG: ABC transporter ATP-binding protein [Opitutaceae bacterium]|nr:ABC transporter ATP-binding protein [Opitutaceae bacterium]
MSRPPNTDSLPAPAAPSRDADPVLEISGLKKAFRTPEGELRTVVSVPRFVLGARSQVALKGESGSGKTTFLNLIAGIVHADSGRITLDGIDLTGLRESARDRLRATKVGCVYQTFNLLQGYTCLENVLLAMTFGKGRDPAFARELLDRVELSHRLGYRPRQLSVGQQQRVAVARALANRPRLVLADEPTGNLDATHAAETLTLLRETCAEQGAALLLVSHDRDILARFEDVQDFRALNQPAA